MVFFAKVLMAGMFFGTIDYLVWGKWVMRKSGTIAFKDGDGEGTKLERKRESMRMAM